MFKVKLGQPRNKQLLRMMEDPEKRQAIDKAELSFYQDTRKEELFALKEELFFTIDERAHEADLERAGPRLPESGRSGRLRAAGFDHANSPTSISDARR